MMSINLRCVRISSWSRDALSMCGERSRSKRCLRVGRGTGPRTTDVTGAVELPKDKEMVMPGDNVSITVKLIAPIAMEEGLRFAIREGGRTVGAGVVAKILE